MKHKEKKTNLDFLFEINVDEINKKLEKTSLDELIKEDVKTSWFILNKDLRISHKGLMKSIDKLSTQDTIFKDFDAFRNYCEEVKREVDPAYSFKKSTGEYEEDLYTVSIEGVPGKQPYSLIISQVREEYSVLLTVGDGHALWYAFDVDSDSYRTNIYRFSEYFNLRKMAAQILKGTRKENKKYKLYFRSMKDRYYCS